MNSPFYEFDICAFFHVKPKTKLFIVCPGVLSDIFHSKHTKFSYMLQNLTCIAFTVFAAGRIFVPPACKVSKEIYSKWA